ncbi:MAG: alpha/beta fold hydrolase [Pseudomonadales bacterium]
MEVLRTPDERFEGLPDRDFQPHCQDVSSGQGENLRMAYVDVGPRDAEVVLCVHGEPSWSYLYRRMIPVFTDAGLRSVAPDLIGFGRSDKPANREDYTYQRHVDWMTAWLEALDLERITLVCQDWGGLIRGS